jgi:xanthine dehydrogenase accessory factor
MRELYNTCAGLLAGGEDVVMATIISQSGSAPRTAGTKMLVRRDGSMVGTIGGGLLEAQVLEQAREVFRTGRAAVREFNLTGADAASMDMICGGRLDVFICLLSAGFPGNVEIYRTLGNILHTGQKGFLVTRLAGADGRDQPGQCLLLENGLPMGFALSADRQAQLRLAGWIRYPRLVQLGDERFLTEPVSAPGTVYIFGAGHVSQQVARLTSLVDFRTVVLDDREEFANRQRFPQADEIIVLEDFAGCLKDLPISTDSYLVIVTRGHRYDLTVLEQALSTGACYIGMIGSHRKRDAIYRALREKGVAREQLDGVHSPIGLDIGAETPEEIAVSIVAQLIKARGKPMDGQA